MPDLYDPRGRRLTLGARLGRGGEGEVFEVVGEPALVAKVLYPAGRTRAKLDKVEAMLAQPPTGAYEALEDLPVLTWPRLVLHSSPMGQGQSTFVGYAMARIAPRDFVPFYQLSSAGRRRELGGNALTLDRLVVLGMRLCHVVRTLHRFGYAVGDLNDRNVLVSRRLTPLLMDTDSFQVPRPGRLGVGHFPSVVGDQQYWPPELLAVDLATHKGSRETGDRFALGVLLFQLFMDGMRPYQSRGSLVAGLETLADKTKAGHYPWDRPRKGVLEPPASAPDYRALPKPIRQAFERCFVDGHRSPSKRPSADDWYAALAKVKAAGYRACTAEARHVFAADLAACPWCRDANDPFGDARPAGRAQRPSRLPRPVPVVRAATQLPKRRKAGGPPQLAVTAAVPSATGKRGALAAAPVALRPAPVPVPAAKPRRKAVAAPARKGRPAAASRPRGKRKTARARRPLAERLPARGAWMGGLALAFASPTAVLASMPLGLEQKVTMAIATVLFVGAAGLAPTLRWLQGRRPKLAAAWLWLTAAAAGTLGLVGAGRWTWLLCTTGLACLALGLAAFAWMEKGRPDAFRPTGVGLLHGAVGIPVSYLPVFAIWLWDL